MKKNILFAVLFGFFSLALFSQKNEQLASTTPVVSSLPPAAGNGGIPSLIPLPAKMVLGSGSFTLTSDIQVVADKASRTTARQFVEYISHSTGFKIKVTGKASAGSSAVIRFIQDPGLTLFGKEGYQLTVTPQGINISAAGQTGLFYGIQTLRQLMPPQIFAATPVKDVAWIVPCVSIEDEPRFAWRGLMLDSGHDFQTKDFVLRFIDLMALHKLNIFHWHLTDLGTWSIEIKGYPQLLDAGTRGPGVKPGHYTQDEIREVVRYASERHITTVPEIDMPGHLTPALLAYPGLYCPLPQQLDKNGKPVRPWEICVGNDKTYVFAEAVLSQIVGLFPGKYVHIGGDECPKDRWMRCPLCQEKMKKENLADGKALQSYFIRHLESFLQAKGRKLIGWDEILEGGLAPNATVMSWRGMEGGIEAARAGHDVVMAPRQFTYFDYPNTPVSKVYSFDPVPVELTYEQATHILGGQGQMWTDNHPTENAIDALVYPRSAALAEILWSPKAKVDYEGFMKRLQDHLVRLDVLSVKYRR